MSARHAPARARSTGVLRRLIAPATAILMLATAIPAASAAGGSITGNLTGSGGTPAAGISVQACPDDLALDCVSTTSGADGTYSVAVGDGTWTIDFYDSNGEQANGYYSAAGLTTYANATHISVAGQPVTINFQFPAAYRISGTVRNAAGQPVSGVQVDTCTNGNSAQCGYAESTSDGTYETSAIAAGTYILTFYTLDGTYAAAFLGPDGAHTTIEANARQFVITNANVTGVDFTVAPGVILTGTVTAGDGASSGDLFVFVCERGGLCVPDFAKSGEQYRVALEPGSYTIEVGGDFGQGFSSGWYSAAGWTRRESLATHIAIGAPPRTVTVNLRPTNAPRESFGLNTRLSSAATSALVTLSLAWAGDAPSGGTYRVTDRIDGKSAAALKTYADTAATTQSVSVAVGHRHQFQVQHTGGAIDTNTYSSPSMLLSLVQETSSAVKYTGTWASLTDKNASAGKTRFALNAGATASYTFRGRDIALVATTGPSEGQAKIYLDGKLLTTLDLHASSMTQRKLVFASHWDVPGSHTLKVSVVGTKGHPRVQVDAFALAV